MNVDCLCVVKDILDDITWQLLERGAEIVGLFITAKYMIKRHLTEECLKKCIWCLQKAIFKPLESKFFFLSRYNFSSTPFLIFTWSIFFLSVTVCLHCLAPMVEHRNGNPLRR